MTRLRRIVIVLAVVAGLLALAAGAWFGLRAAGIRVLDGPYTTGILVGSGLFLMVMAAIASIVYGMWADRRDSGPSRRWRV